MRSRRAGGTRPIRALACAAMRRRTRVSTGSLALALAIAAAAAACESEPARAYDQPGRRLVPGERSGVATETIAGRRVIRVEREPADGERAGLVCVIELDEPGTPRPLPSERLLALPSKDASAALVVSGGRGRPFESRNAKGSVRVRDFQGHSAVYVDLTFAGEEVDPAILLPVNVFQDDPRWLRVTGTFEAYPLR